MDMDTVPVWTGVPFALRATDSGTAPAPDSLKLTAKGSKTISVVVGDGGTQVDQELHLSLQGEIAPSVYVDALLADVGREAGDQRTATLQEVDQIYFNVESPSYFLHLGDQTWTQDALGLSGLSRSTLGAGAGAKFGHTQVRGAVGYDELKHISSVFRGVDGQRSGYLLSTGATDDYLSIVPRSETVWMNGTKLSRGTDYTVNYAGGVLDFKGLIVPGTDDEIRVEFDAYNSGGIQTMKAADWNYRSKNLWLDVAGFRLESDVDRLKRGTWSDEDYKMLRSDTGGTFDRSDTLDALDRPWRMDRMGARLRWETGNRFFADGEMNYGKMDTNTVSDKVGGPSGRAFRWKLSSDSTALQSHGILKIENSGDYIEEGYKPGLYSGAERNWDSYKLKNDWDLDSAGLPGGLRYDDFLSQIRLPARYFVGGEWGYRRSIEDSSWNSSRARIFLNHRGTSATSAISLVRVASVQDKEMTRYQALGNAAYTEGFIRPFGNGAYGIWYKDSASASWKSEHREAQGGFEIGRDKWNVREALLGSQVRTDENSDALEDSLRTRQWDQSAGYTGKNFSFTHLLQYKKTWLDTAGDADSWVAEQELTFGRGDRDALSGKATYNLGLTKEQPYVAIYKKVADGTGDVLYDSLTGEFIEGVDNGDYTYEGMGRDDSVPAVIASSAALALNFSLLPGALLHVTHGFLHDISFGFDGSAEARDTTGTRIYLPSFLRADLRDRTSGKFSYEGDLEWTHPSGDGTVAYKVGTASEKKNTAQYYFENRLWHEWDGSYLGRKKETWNAEARLEYVDLNSVQVMNWNIREVRLYWKRELPLNFAVKPGGMLRKGSGEDEEETLDALLRQGSLELLWDNQKGATASQSFSATYVTTRNDELPYSMMSGFDKGVTYRAESVASVDAAKFLTLSLRYVIRFGSAESAVFQKLSMEAKAFF